jgi:phosphinothricin acetyltransferase
MTAWQFRTAEPRDLPRIVEIYNASIPGRLATADLKPVSVESRHAWLLAHTTDKHPLIVAESGGAIGGWASLGPFYGRPAYHRTAEVSVYVAPEMCRQGLGAALTDEVLRLCPQLGIHTLLAFIFGHNEPSIRLFKRKGFELWGHLPRIADMDGEERDLDIYGLRVQA